jgi:CPA2 family monovalent cation:H+ antiporter-2
MLLDTRTVVGNYQYVALIVLVIIIVKILTGAFSAAVLGMPARICVFSGLALCQIGEFSFVLAKNGLDSALIPVGVYQVFLAGAIITMALTPFTMNAAPGVVDLLYRVAPKHAVHKKPVASDTLKPEEELFNHIVIAGYGISGKSVAQAATLAGIPYMVIELNPEIIKKERSSYRPNFIFGDAVQKEVLEHAGIRNARTLVVVVSEEEAIPRIIHTARQISPTIHNLARTRHVRDARYLLDLGADEVISEEFEAALEIFTRALQRYQLPDAEIARIIERSKTVGNAMFSKGTDSQDIQARNFETLFKATHVHAIRVEPGSPADGKTIAELDLKNRFGILNFALRKGPANLIHAPDTTRLVAGDTLIFFITDQKAGEIIPLFSGT